MPTARIHGRPPFAPLRAWERAGVLLLALLTLLFAGVVVQRGAFLKRRQTDADVYFRAAWALRAGVDPYSVHDTNNWTYLYPPALAILAMPLAQEPPDGRVPLIGVAPSDCPELSPSQRLAWQTPYPLALGVWYALGAIACVAAVSWLARTTDLCSIHARVRAEKASLPTRTRRWWVARVAPLLICLPAIASTLARGQVNTLLLASICGAMLLLIRRRDFGAGAALSLAICIKIFPAFLLLYALITHRFRVLWGALAGCMLWLVVLPLMTLGPTRALETTRQFAAAMLAPMAHVATGTTTPADAASLPAISASPLALSKQREFEGAFNNQSLLAAIHNWRHWGIAMRTRAIVPDATDRAIFLALAAVLVAFTIACAWRAGLLHLAPSPLAHALLFSSLITLMLALSPICHTHYFALHLPAIACLLALAWDRLPTVDLAPAPLLAIAFYLLAMLLPRVPALEPYLKPANLMTLAGLALWALCARTLWALATPSPTPQSRSNPPTLTRTPAL